MKNTINDSLEKILVNSNHQIDSLNNLNTVLLDSISNFNDSSIAIGNNQLAGIPLELARILIPVFVTISIFTIGQLISWTKAKHEKKKEIESYRHIILLWIDLIEKPLNQQIESCKDFSTRLLKSENIIPIKFEYNNLLAEKVADFPINIYIKTFIINTKGSDKKENWCFSLISNFTFLKEIQKSIKSSYEKYQFETLDIMKDWNSNFTKLDDIIAVQTRLFKIPESNYPYSEFHIKIMRITNDWMGNSPNGISSFKNTIENLITPLSEIVKSELKTDSSNEYAFSLSSCLRDLRIINTKWQAHLTYKDLFNTYAKQIEDSYGNLKKTREKINSNTKIKSIFRIQ